MSDKEQRRIYLENLIRFCEDYNSFFIPAAMLAGGAGIRLQDIYTQLEIESREEHERFNIDYFLENLKNFGGERSSVSPTIRTFSDEYRTLNSIDEHQILFEDEIHNSSENDTEIENSEASNSQMRWFLSAPGGGKTTLLKMLTFTYAIDTYYGEFGRYPYKDETVISDIRPICETIKGSVYFENMDGAYPVFVKIRDLEENRYEELSTSDDLEVLLVESISRIAGDRIFDAEAFWKQDNKWVLIVDGVEEFTSSELRDKFLSVLSAYTNDKGIPCYLSSRYREFREALYSNEGDFQYVIKELSIESPLVRDFAEKWYKALNDISGRKEMDVDKDFIIPLKNNANISRIVSNPLELTSLLMISSYDSYLPSDFAKIYGRSIELWLSWSNYDRYNIEDMLRQLSHVAYKMAVSDINRITIKHDVLREYIRQAREDLKRYYQQEWSTDEKDIDKFISFLCRSHLIKESGGEYEFAHRQYQAYLVSYCIKNNLFSRENRSSNRFDYIKGHIEARDDFWNQTILITAMLDIDLRDNIIDALMKLSDQTNILTGIRTNYFISRLIELAIIPGINFDLYEKEDLYKRIVQSDMSLILFSSKSVDIKKLFDANDTKSNDLFIDIAAGRIEQLPDDKVIAYKERLTNIIFYCIWNCDVSDDAFRKALEVFLDNYITNSLIKTLYTEKQINIHNRHKEDMLLKAGKDNLLSGNQSDFYMIIAVLLGYRGDGTPYDVIDELIAENTFEANATAINILVIAAWLNSSNSANTLGYSVEPERFNKYTEFVNQGITDSEHSQLRRDYLAATEDIFKLGLMNSENGWFCNETFQFVLRTVLDNFVKLGSITDMKERELSRDLYYIARYPLEFSKNAGTVLEEFSDASKEIVKQIHKVFTGSNDLMNRIYAFKLLLLLSPDENSVDNLMAVLRDAVSNNEIIKKNYATVKIKKEYQLIISQIGEQIE